MTVQVLCSDSRNKARVSPWTQEQSFFLLCTGSIFLMAGSQLQSHHL